MSQLRKNTNIRTSQPINSKSKQLQPTKRKALRENRAELEWFRTLYESLPCICLALNSAGRVLSVSQFGAACLGYNATELTQKSFVSILRSEDQVQSQAQLAALQQQPQGTRQWNMRLLSKNGETIEVKAIACLVSASQSNSIINLVCEKITECQPLEDIHPHQQYEDPLHQSEARLRLALEAAGMGIWDWNIATDEIVYSDSLKPVLSRQSNPTRLTYQEFLNCVHPDDQELVDRTVTRAIKQGSDYNSEFRVIWPDGNIHWLGDKGRVYYDKSGQPLRMVGVTMDITSRKQAETALRQQLIKEKLVGAIARRIRKHLKLEKILKATVAEVRQVLQCDRVLICRVWPNGTGTVLTESVVSPYRAILGATFLADNFPLETREQYIQGRICAISDVEQADLPLCLVKLVQQFAVKAKLIVPIIQDQQLWGLLITHQCSQTRQWQQTEIDLLSAIATQVASAIHQSQLYEQEKAQTIREQLLNQLTQAIRSSLDLETIFATAVRETVQQLELDRAYIVEYQPKRKVWVHVSEYSKNPNAQRILGSEIPDEYNPIADQLKQLQIVKIDNTDALGDPINRELAEDLPGAWLLVPLQVGSSVWGSFTLGRDAHPYRWQESEIELIRAVADQIAIAIQQAELYQQSRIATTQALTQAQQLEQTLRELQKTQAHLVQSEKMSSLGQLVAGVAHEINNPVSFIYGNLTHATGYAQDILNLIELYQDHYSNPTPEIQSEIEEIDLEFLIEDLPKLLDSMKLGAERLCEIVAALRNFSHITDVDIHAVDLHEGLESTLMILHNRLKASGKHPEIQVIREYGDIPKVECYAGQMNQVFMNLLVNAIDAIDEQNQMRSPEDIKANPSFIRVRTELFNDNEVAIRIIDNGLGMTEDVKAKLFDPFFTTKPLGAGTGLGLSISYQIVVEKHGGKLYCSSQVGKGTEFVIQIPRLHKIHEDG
jgi:PAS domain S-box-containing protein